MGSARRLLVATSCVLLVAALTAVCVVAVHLATEPSPAQLRAEAAARARARLVRLENRDVRAAEALVAPTLPARPGASAPSIGDGLFATPLASHRVVGFVPYWTLADLRPADYASASTLCYFGPTLTKDATFAETDPVWNSAAFTDFVAAAHDAGDEVLLTVSTTNETVIGDVLAHPGPSADRLAAQVATTLAARGLDGADLDIEGTETAQRGALVAFVGDFERALDGRRPGATLIVDTYVDAASEAHGFFDVSALARVSNELFVMGYDMYDGDEPSANAPLYASNLGLSDVQALIAYTRLVPADKLVLGMPFYGDEFTTSPAGATSSSPLALTYSAIVAAGHDARWDPVSRTPYATFSEAGSTRVIWYDDPVSLALKSALAQVFHLDGVGAWALGMEGGDPTMLEALTGDAAPLRTPGTS